MQEFRSDTIQAVARVMAGSFLEDPLNQYNLAGVKNKEELLYQHSILHTRHAVKSGSLYLLDGNPRVFMVGVDSDKASGFADALLNLTIAVKTLLMLDKQDRKVILTNNKKTRQVVNFTWQKDFVKGRFYRVKIIAIDKAMRGTGAFRGLITPRIEFCDEQKLPMILETHNPNNVGLYGHFGFELVKTIASQSIEIKQYCMIRQPTIPGA